MVSTTCRLTAGLLVGVACAVAAATTSIEPVLTAASSCEAVASMAFRDAKITAADPVAAGAFSPPGARNAQPNTAFRQLPAFCRVAATLNAIERFRYQDRGLAAGVGLERQVPGGRQRRLGGIDQLRRNGGGADARVCHELDRHAATGRRRPVDAESREVDRFRLSRRPRNDGRRARPSLQPTTATVRRLSYFNGCSAGGRQGLIEAQRYPDDFDGIVAGAPALNTTGRAAFAMSIAQAMHKDEASYIPPGKYPLIHDAVLDACDAADGVKDGVLENPKRCTFDPKVLECRGGDAATCLTAPQVRNGADDATRRS